MERRSEFGVCIESELERNSRVLDSVEDALEGQNSIERCIVEHSEESTGQMYANESLTPASDITDEEDKITSPLNNRENNKVNHSATPRFLLKYCQFIEKHLCIAFGKFVNMINNHRDSSGHVWTLEIKNHHKVYTVAFLFLFTVSDFSDCNKTKNNVLFNNAMEG